MGWKRRSVSNSGLALLAVKRHAFEHQANRLPVDAQHNAQHEQRHALWRMPLLMLGVVLRIHWQALRLMLKRVPFYGQQGQPPAAGAPSLPSH